MAEPVLTEQKGSVQWITINREERRNALNEEVVRAIDAAIKTAVDGGRVRAIVITGAGDRAFCAGADLATGVKGFAFAVDFSQPTHYVANLFKRLQECTLPVIARVNGHAIAGGFGLLCACDMAIAADDIRIGTTESRIGVTPMMILPYMLRLLPPRKLQEMCITGKEFSAEEALEWGVLSYTVPRAQLDSKLEWLLSRFTDNSPTAIRLGKQAFNAIRDMGLRESLDYAQLMVPVMSSTNDAQEGIAAFREKRRPNFTGT